MMRVNHLYVFELLEHPWEPISLRWLDLLLQPLLSSVSQNVAFAMLASRARQPVLQVKVCTCGCLWLLYTAYTGHLLYICHSYLIPLFSSSTSTSCAHCTDCSSKQLSLESTEDFWMQTSYFPVSCLVLHVLFLWSLTYLSESAESACAACVAGKYSAHAGGNNIHLCNNPIVWC